MGGDEKAMTDIQLNVAKVKVLVTGPSSNLYCAQACDCTGAWSYVLQRK